MACSRAVWHRAPSKELPCTHIVLSTRVRLEEADSIGVALRLRVLWQTNSNNNDKNSSHKQAVVTIIAIVIKLNKY